MPFVKEGDESNTEISSLYKEINDELQIVKIPNILKTTSIDPQIARWFWENSNALISYSIESVYEEVVETMIIQSLKHQKSYEKFAIEQEGGK